MDVLKCHGCRNDIFVIEATPADFGGAAELTAFVRHLCDRRGPLGSDGVYFFDAGRPSVAAWFFNPDGSAAELCANGLRCLGRVILDRRGEDSATITTGRYEFAVRRAPATAHGVRQVAVDLPAAEFEPDPPVVAGTRTLLDARLPALGPRLRFTAVAVPNPHLVAVVASFAEPALAAIGALVAAAPATFPAGANVSFLLPLPGAEIFVATFERGAGPTLSCGSAVVASRAAYSRTGRCEPGRDLLVRTPGGPARVTLRVTGGRWLPTLEGNATCVYRAAVDAVSLTAGRRMAVDIQRFDDEIAAYAALDAINLKTLSAGGVHLARR